MKPYYQDLHNTLYNMNFLDNDLPDESIQMVVTSPPYWGLRKYAGVQDLVWGDNHCEHEWGAEIISKTNDSNRGTMEWQTGGNPAAKVLGQKVSQGNFCSLCGAWKGAYGLEPTPEMYVQHTVEILREIRRVLRKDGVVFWNIGDSYAGSGGPGSQYDTKHPGYGKQFEKFPNPNRTGIGTIKPKDLCLIPFRVAIAAQEDGWWVRSIIIWSKPNPMPESVTDRPTESHEYILMLTKSARYYWDQDAVREPQKPESLERLKTGWHGDEQRGYPNGPQSHIGNYFNKTDGEIASLGGRNIRTVWEFPTQPYPEAHFAVFPEKLPELCIKAASKEGDTVLDPFQGAGTTLWVAKKLNRKAIGFDISGEYCKLTVNRIRQQVML